MNKLIWATLIGATASLSFGQFATATEIWAGQNGVKANRGGTDDVTAYSNVTTFSGFGFAWGSGQVGTGTQGVTSTWIDADDINFLPSEIGKGVTSFTFSSFNGNAAAVSASPTVVFWDDTAGSPSTMLAAVRFAPLSLTANSVNLWTYSPSTALFNLPASGKLWMGVSWDDFADIADTGITDAQLANVGQAIFDPPTVGSSADNFWSSDNFGSNLGNNPAGSDGWSFGGPPNNPNANFGNAITTVPEPASMAAIGLGIAGLISRRRKK